MKLLRLVIFFVLTLALPSLGLAGITTADRCNMTSMSASSDMMPMSMMNCGVADSGGPDGKLKSHSGCKMDAACKTFSADQPLITLLSIHRPLPAAQAVAPHPASPVLAHDPDGLWRPPQQL